MHNSDAHTLVVNSMDDVLRKRILLLENLILISIAGIISVKGDVLYTDDDCVFLLSHKTFENAIYGQDIIWFVEFYNSWCGTCIRFAPTWKQLGEDIKGGHSIVRLAALDCSVEDHVQICNSHIGNRGYPTLVLFPPQYTPNFVTDQRKFVEGALEMKDLKSTMFSYIENQLSQLKTEVGSPLVPLSSVEDIKSTVTGETVYTLLLFESSPSTLGLQVVLEAMKHKQLLVRRIGNADANKYKVTVFPSLYLVNKSLALKELASGPDHGQYKEALMGLVGMETDDDKEYEGAGDHPVESEVKATHQHAGTVVIHMVDLESTLHYSLKQEVAACGDIGGQNLDALKSFVYVLAKYFPGREPVMSYLWAIYNWIKMQTSSMTGSEWLASIEGLQTASMYLPSTVEWACCEGSTKQYRGYPCGLWTLFHTLTVSAADHHDKFADADAKEVLNAMKGYITNYFGCRECARNFQKEVQDLSTKVFQPDDAILYLWRVHNSVNQRLHGDLTEDPKHPKVQFPPQELCTSCRVETPGTDRFTWTEGEVLNFLKQVYLKNIVRDTDGQQLLSDLNGQNEKANIGEDPLRSRVILNPRDPKIRRDFEEFYKQRKEKEDSKSRGIAKNLELSYDLQKQLLRSKFLDIEQDAYNESKEYQSFWNFSSFDMSMCILFYLLCTVIILGVYFNLMIRKRSLVKKQLHGWL